MAMNSTTLGNAMADRILSVVGIAEGEMPPDMRDVMIGLADEIISHIQASAVVTVPVTATDAGLQSYTVPPAGPVPTAGPLTPTVLDGSIA